MVCFIINQISQADMSQMDIFSFHVGMLDETILRCELEDISEINEPNFPSCNKSILSSWKAKFSLIRVATHHSTMTRIGCLHAKLSREQSNIFII